MNKYKIVHPFESDLIHTSDSLTGGIYKCYNELKEKHIKTYIFIVHEINTGLLHYLNIPKNHQENHQENHQDILKDIQRDIMPSPKKEDYESLTKRIDKIECDIEVIKNMIQNKNINNEEDDKCIII